MGAGCQTYGSRPSDSLDQVVRFMEVGCQTELGASCETYGSRHSRTHGLRPSDLLNQVVMSMRVDWLYTGCNVY